MTKSRFLMEFLEVGGVLTLLEILTIPQTSDKDKTQSLLLLNKIASNGRKYKEFICESDGIKSVKECLSKTTASLCQDAGRHLLISLGTGNPKFLSNVLDGLISIISVAGVAPSSVQVAAQCIRALLSTVKEYPVRLIVSCTDLLKSQHIQLQFEGYELAKELVKINDYREDLLFVLVSILKIVFESKCDGQQSLKTTEFINAKNWDEEGSIQAVITESEKNPILVKIDISQNHLEMKRIFFGHSQQYYVAKLIGEFATDYDSMAEKLIEMGVVDGLLNVIANVGHLESQQIAGNNLVYLIKRFKFVHKMVLDKVGIDLMNLVLVALGFI